MSTVIRLGMLLLLAVTISCKRSAQEEHLPAASAVPHAAAGVATGSASAPPSVASPSSSSQPVSTTSAKPAAPGPASTGSGPGCEEAERRWLTQTAKPAAPEPSGQVIQVLTDTLNHGTYLSKCDVPQRVGVSICAAIANGKAAGVTVILDGGSAAMADCVAGAVEAMSFAKYQDMLLARTTFAAVP